MNYQILICDNKTSVLLIHDIMFNLIQKLFNNGRAVTDLNLPCWSQNTTLAHFSLDHTAHLFLRKNVAVETFLFLFSGKELLFPITWFYCSAVRGVINWTYFKFLIQYQSTSNVMILKLVKLVTYNKSIIHFIIPGYILFYVSSNSLFTNK